jgi:hypothetical protein
VSILAGEPVMAPAQWTDIAHGANWMRAKGASLVPNHNPYYEIKDATEHTFRYRVKTRSTAIQRVWTVSVVLQPGVGEPETAYVLLKAPAGAGTAIRGSVRAAVDGLSSTFPAQVTFVETLGSKAAAETEISISIQVLTNLAGVANTTTARVLGIECYEQDRPSLNDDTSDQGTLIETVRHSEPIFRLDNASVYGVLQTIAEADARRVGIFHVGYPGGIIRLSATPANVFTLPPYIQAPKITRGSTTKAVKWSAYAAMSAGGGSGTVAISTSVSGVSDSMAFTSTTPAWGTAQTVSINCDDFDEEDGWRPDTLQITTAGDGTRTLTTYFVSMWVDDVA